MQNPLILALAIVLTAGAGAVDISTAGLMYPDQVHAFYQSRNFKDAWTDPKLVRELEQAIGGASLHGLLPENYHLNEFAQRKDALFTDAFLAYAHDLHFGRSSHLLKGQDWKITHSDSELLPVLEKALSSGHVGSQLADLAPPIESYRSLQNALVEYRQLAASGGWPTFPKPIDVKQTEKSDELDSLRRRLEMTKDFETNMELVDAVTRFQQRHGLKPDGIVGKQTIAALSVSAEERVTQIELGLERMRWMFSELPERFVIVNVPAFDLQIFEQGKAIQTMRVIVGKTTWCTPTFLSSEINQIILNPYWYVPSVIAKKEIYPLLQKDPDYLKKHNIRMIPRAQGGIQLRQSPGPRNSLGRIKFLFPNCCDCYLHDTPEKQLFDKVLRLFSHGCIRVEEAFDLAQWILQEEGWSEEELAPAIESNKTQTIRLTKPTPIFVVYLTAWISEDGTIQFRNDVYGKDKELIRSLIKP